MKVKKLFKSMSFHHQHLTGSKNQFSQISTKTFMDVSCSWQSSTHQISSFKKRYFDSGEGLFNEILNELAKRLNFKGYYYGFNSVTCKEFIDTREFLYNIAEIVALDGYAFLSSSDSIWNFMMLNVECA